MGRLLQGDALAAFNAHKPNRTATETNEAFEKCEKKLTAHVCPPRSATNQKRFMRRFLKKPYLMCIQDDVARVVEMNEYLPLMPEIGGEEPDILPEDELLELLEFILPE